MFACLYLLCEEISRPTTVSKKLLNLAEPTFDAAVPAAMGTDREDCGSFRQLVAWTTAGDPQFRRWGSMAASAAVEHGWYRFSLQFFFPLLRSSFLDISAPAADLIIAIHKSLQNVLHRNRLSGSGLLAQQTLFEPHLKKLFRFNLRLAEKLKLS